MIITFNVLFLVLPFLSSLAVCALALQQDLLSSLLCCHRSCYIVLVSSCPLILSLILPFQILEAWNFLLSYCTLVLLPLE